MARSRSIATGIEVTMIVLVTALLVHRFVPGRAAASSPSNAVTFKLTGLDGNPISPSVCEDKAVLLNFRASWCPWPAPENCAAGGLHHLSLRDSIFGTESFP